MDFKELGLMAEAARKYEPPICIYLRPAGLVFETCYRPFILKHFLTYEQLQECQHPEKTIMDKLNDEIRNTIRDAQGAATNKY